MKSPVEHLMAATEKSGELEVAEECTFLKRLSHFSVLARGLLVAGTPTPQRAPVAEAEMPADAGGVRRRRRRLCTSPPPPPLILLLPVVALGRIVPFGDPALIVVVAV